ncbi:MAG TPA: nucleoside monophosphate kinase [Candidatus Paceibacterota bacterium]|nr:nucleoside monophosphate kinase [Candidatus Paceibacterota bacterium]
MQPHAYIFVGHSGAGKGTQVALLKEKIKAHHPETDIFHLETGALFRRFSTDTTYTASKTAALMGQGKLPPAFIGVHVWSHELVGRYDNEPFVIIDGTPRVAIEVPLLLSAAAFYNWEVYVIALEVSDAWALDRLVARGRDDDRDEQERTERMRWFHSNVVPAITLLQHSPDVHYERINGERPIEVVHADICARLGFA